MNILIINASGQTGLAIAKELSSPNHNLILTSGSSNSVDGIKAIQWRYEGEDSVNSLFNDVKSKFDEIHAVVNCLGSIFLKPAHLTKKEDFDSVIDLNLRSSFFILKNSIPLMRKTGGSLLFFSSAAANIGLANHEAIASAKGGLEGLVKSAAATYAKNNIRVNALALGLVESNLSDGIVSNPVALEISKKMHSIGRIGSPEIIAKFATPLILDSSSWITGSIINIDGGLSTTKLVS